MLDQIDAISRPYFNIRSKTQERGIEINNSKDSHTNQDKNVVFNCVQLTLNVGSN